MDPALTHVFGTHTVTTYPAPKYCFTLGGAALSPGDTSVVLYCVWSPLSGPTLFFFCKAVRGLYLVLQGVLFSSHHAIDCAGRAQAISIAHPAG